MQIDIFKDGDVIDRINVPTCPQKGNVIILKKSDSSKRFMKVTEVCFQPWIRVIGESYTHGIVVSVKEADEIGDFHGEKDTGK